LSCWMTRSRAKVRAVYAQQLGLTVTGTLGVLLRAKQKGHLVAVTPCVDRLNQLGFRLAARTRAAVIKLADESELVCTRRVAPLRSSCPDP